MPMRPDAQASLAFYQALDPGGFLTASAPVHAWQALCWEPDLPLTEEQMQLFLNGLPASFEEAGPICAAFSPDADRVFLLLAHARQAAAIHQNLVFWLCAHLLNEICTLQLEREGVLLVSPLYTAPCTPCLFLEACQALEDFGTWWETASAIPASDARVYRSTAQESLRRRRYEQFITYPLRLAARVRDPGPFLISFVPILMEAVWNQHADIAQRDLTAALSMPLLTRRPNEALQTWTRSIPGLLNAREERMESHDMTRVIQAIEQDPSLPYTLENLSRSVGVTAPYFCRLFREQTGQTFSTYLVSTRMTLAQKLLREGRLSLQEIADLCGYPNKSYFCKVFRTFTGMTTGQYEEHMRRKPEPPVPDTP